MDVLDLKNYKIEKLPSRKRGSIETMLAFFGIPLSLLSFVAIFWFVDVPFLHPGAIDPAQLGESAKEFFDKVGAQEFSRANIAMLAIFVASIILWMTEAIPNYLTSLILIVAIVLTGVLPEKVAYAQLGHSVMWLNIMSFVLASMLVATGVAKRFALWFIVKFGKNANTIFFSFIVINLVLSVFISATTAKAAILLPIFMVVAAVYGATGGQNKNNFGRGLVLQNLFHINIGASGFLTGSGANLIAASLIGGAIGSEVFYSDWLAAAFPMSILLMIIGWFVSTKIIFPLKPEERLPQIDGGMDRLRQELSSMGNLSFKEVKSIVIFGSILTLWVTDKWHGISPTAVAFVGGIVALLPRVGVVKWNDVDIPWHLLLFSAGAYTLGKGLDQTDLPAIAVNSIFNHLGFSNETPYWVLYLVLTGAMLFSALIFQSKTMRALIFVPIAIGVSTKFGLPIVALALPVALLIEHVYVLPFNSKPAALLFVTDHYSLSDTFKFGFTMMVIAWILNIISAMTYFKWLGITPGF